MATFPTSSAQRRLWFLDRFEPGTSLYNVPFAARLRGPLDLGALETCLDGVVRRHETLRTTFDEVDGEPVQRVAPRGRLPLRRIDLTELGEEARESRALRLADDEAVRPFDLRRGPLARALAVRLDAAEHLLVLTLHHIASDAWSQAVLLRELTTLYAAFRDGRPPVLPDLPLQYADYAVWQRESLEGGDLRGQVEWWRRRLEGAPAVLPLPTDRPRPPASTGRGAGHAVAVPRAIATRLATLSRACGVTPFMTILASYQALLARWSDCRDVVVGAPVAGRAEPDLERLIGCFINTLPLRADLSGDPTFRELLRTTRDACLDAYARQEAPFDRILDAVRPERRLDSAPLFQVMLAVDTLPPPILDLPEVVFSILPISTRTSKYDLTLALRSGEDGLRGTMEYSTDLFDEGTIARLCADFATLLERVTADPDRRLSSLLEGLVPRIATATAPASSGVGSSPAARTDEPPRGPIERTLARLWRELLRLESVGRHENFFAAGGDSILSLQVVARARQAGIRLTPRLLFQHPTIAGLAAVAGAAGPADAEQGPVTGEVPLTPIQRWFFEQDPPEPHHWNQTLVLKTRRTLAPDVLEEAVRLLDRHHDALRLRFERGASGWTQTIVPPGAPPPVERHDLSALTETEQTGAITAAAARAQASLDLERGPLVRFVQFDRGGRRSGRLVIAAHHLAIDGVSWRILLEDLDRACRHLARGEPVRLPAKTTSFRDWATRLREHARGGGAREELDDWLREAGPQAGESVPGPLDDPGLEGEAASLVVDLDAATTRLLLRDAHRAHRTGVDELLLAGLVLAFARTTGEAALRVDLEGHGREDLFDGIDLSRTIGWFTSVFPVVLRAGPPGDPGATLRAVRDRLRRVPRSGLGFGLLRDLADDAEAALRLRALPKARVLFNYLGRLDPPTRDGLFVPTRQEAGPSRAAGARRSHPHEIDVHVSGGRLRLRWTYAAGEARRSTVERLAGAWLEALRELAARRRRRGAGRSEPADFPLADLDRRELDLVLKGGTVDDVYPLSPMQQGMLFHTLMAPASGEYVEQLACTLRGDLDVAAFEKAWDAMLRRHDSLRVEVRWQRRGRPLQIVRGSARAAPARHDWRDLAPDEQERRWDRLLRDDRARGFDPARAPLLRNVLCRTDDRAHRWLLSHHHLLLDGWSLAILLKELFACYEEARRGRPVRRRPARPYADYIAWLERQSEAGSEPFWRATLAGIRSATPLSTARPGAPAVAAPGREERCTSLDPAATSALAGLARREGLTLNTIVLGAWALLLSRWSGTDDILFGATVSGRPPALPGVEEIVGLFINTLPVRARVERGAGLLPWLRRLQADQAETRQYEHVSLARIQGWSEVPPGRPLFESVLVFENYPVDTRLRELTGSLAVEGIRSVEWTNYPLTVGVGPGERLALSLSYDTRRFDAAGIERRLDELLRLLERIALDPEMVLGEPAGGTATGGARAAAITAPPEAAPAAADDTRPTRGVHELVAARASRTPAATAVVCGGRTLTYSAVEERARRFARTLRRRGARPEARVAVCLERSLDLPVVLLGILESGAAYLPLDPGSPPDRLRRLVDESRPALVVTERALRGRLPAGAAPHVIEIDAPSPPVGSAAADPPPPPVAPDHLAYVIYTSGSTGAPKGVQVTHGALASHALAVAERYALRPDDRVLQFAAPSFDVAAEELFPTLLSGAAVVLRDEGTPLVAADFLAWVDRERMTVLNLPAAYWHALVDALGDGGPGSLDLPACVRLVIVGSDEVSADRWSRFRLRFPGVRLINAYGPTEATITATLHEEGPGQAPPEGRVVPIGRPLPHVEALVLDSALRPVDEGAPGDLYLGGAGLARGYLSRPDLTAERFLPHPREPGARLYRTGDRVRRRADGALEFLGRGDAQVKVRGYRVEPAEIEAALERHPGIARAVVVAGEAASGGKRLLAYAVPRPGFAPGTGHLRAHLEGLLPAYMVPSAFVILERLPLTPGGKIDRRTLPAPAEAGPTPSLSGALPATGDPVPEIVAGIWADVLGRERVAAGDDFFSLGGHSLLAIQIVSRLRDAFGIDLPLRSLFDHPTVAGLSAEAERVRRDARGLPPVRPLRAEPRPASLPLSFAQERQWFLDQLVPDRPVYNIHVALRLTGRLNAPALREALNGLVRRHETLRTVFASVDGRPAQVVHPGLRLSLPVVDLEGVPGTQREAEALRLATAEARRPFDLRRGPLLRTRLLRLSAERHVLLITMHHIVSDGWSAGVSARELAALYSAAARGEEPALAEPPIQYADFAIWQRDWLRGETLERQLAFWRRQLSDAPETLRLPADRPRPERHSYRGSTREFALSPRLAARLTALSRREGVTLFMTLLAGFQTLLLRYTGQEDLVLGSPIAGRVRTETEGLIGFFVNTLVLRTDLSGDPPFRELLRRVREVCLDAYTHQDLPFEKLVEDLAPERTLSRTPLVQVMFQLQTAAASALELEGLRLEHLDVDSGTTQFDLSVDLLDLPEGLSAMVEYSTDLFDDATIDRLMRGYIALLEGAAADPETRLSELPLQDEPARRSALAWSAGPAVERSEGSLHRLVEAQASRRPAQNALEGDGGAVTYAELDRRAGRLAARLRGQGVAAETRVAVLLDRPADRMAAALGVLKAGGVYLPLDPAHPDDRLASIVEDAGPALILTRGALRRRIAETGVRLIDLDDARGTIERAPAGRPGQRVDPAQAAYLVYTSGSTGRPKGVLVPHAAAVNHALAVARAFDLSPADRALQFASPAFDVSMEEMFSTWSAGATLVLSPEGPAAPAALLDRIARDRLSVLNLPSSYWHEWVAELLAERAALPECLRLVVVGSERIDPRRYADWLRVAPPTVRWIGAYGTTETAVTSLLHEPEFRPWSAPEAGPPAASATHDDAAAATGTVTPAGDLHSKPPDLPIGRPIANVEAYVLDGALRPAPIGAVGELYIGGAGLARGYVSRPEITAERFLPNPHSREPGTRLYRTGDLARLRPDGRIDFLGRADRQVKLRGYRIEPGEIESILRRHPAVQEAAIVLRQDAPGQERLVAYVVPDFEGAASAPALEEEEARRERLDDWRQVHDDEVFNLTSADADPTFNIGGWNSSATGEPIPAEEMREWVDGTVERILALQPRRVLEIGCGTGLLLFRVAPHCESYLGTDFSAAALDHVRRVTAEGGRSLSGVSLLQREADDFGGLDDGRFDLVILNSVVQYFPGLAYLEEVLAGALRRLRAGGTLFLGDLRSLTLARAFHLSLALQRAPATLTLRQIEPLVEKRAFQEEELLIDPALFSHLRRRHEAIDRIEIQLRRGRHHNELTRYRYDAILRSGRPAAKSARAGTPVPPAAVDWRGSGLTLDALRRRLAEESPAALRVTGVPNARLHREALALERLERARPRETVGELRAGLDRLPPGGVDPEAIWALGRELSYAVEIAWSLAARDGRYDALFRRRGRPGPTLAEIAAEGEAARSPGACASNPMKMKLSRRLVKDLPSFLAAATPAWMVPSVFVPLGSLPRAPGGKIDRDALPPPEWPEHAGTRAAPRDALELSLQGLFEDVLEVRPIGVTDSFFDLGGHSLLAVRLTALAQRRLGRVLPLAALFQNPSVERLAMAMRGSAGDGSASHAIPLQPRGGGAPFFCVHPAGGGVLHYLDLARHLGEERPFYGLHAPGLYGERSPMGDVEGLAGAHLTAIRSVRPTGPYALGGWSFGGLVAFEMARRLRAEGERVALLALLDAVPPDPPRGASTGDGAGGADDEDDAEVIAWYAADFVRFFGGDLPEPKRPRLLDAGTLRALEPEERLRYLHGVAAAVNGLPPDAGLERVRRYVEIYRINQGAARRYRPGSVYCGPVALFRAGGADAAAGAVAGWRPWVDGDLTVLPVPGAHDTFIEEPHVPILAEHLRLCLRRALGDS